MHELSTFLKRTMKTQTLKNETLRTVLPFLDKVFATYEPSGAIAMDVAQIASSIRTIVDDTNKVHKDLVNKYALRDEKNECVPLWADEKGNVVPVGTAGAKPQEGSKQVDPAKLVEFNAEWDAVLQKGSEITTVELLAADIRAMPKFNSALAEVIMPFISFAPAPK